MYGIGGARISAQDGCTVRIDPDGSVMAATGVTEQGQGTEAIVRQIVAEAVGVGIDQVRVITGDTLTTPYGGGTWACRGAGIGGEAALQAGMAVKEATLKVAGAMLQATPDALDLVNGEIVDKKTGQSRMPLAELARIVYFRGDTLPPDLPRELMQTRHFITKEYPFAFTNGVQACWLEVDVETGMVQLLKHWCVEDCGRIINPLLVDEQVRGGIVQGLGGALYEHCVYSPEGQLMVGSMADYLVPMAAEMPDIEVGHVETPTRKSLLGAKGAGEAGTAGAPAAVMNAINDALKPLGAKVFAQPFTPERILAALGKVPGRWPERLPERAGAQQARAEASCVRRNFSRGRKGARPPRPSIRARQERLAPPAHACKRANRRIPHALCHRVAIRVWAHGPWFSKISGSWSWHGVTAKQEGGAPWTRMSPERAR